MSMLVKYRVRAAMADNAVTVTFQRPPGKGSASALHIRVEAGSPVVVGRHHLRDVASDPRRISRSHCELQLCSDGAQPSVLVKCFGVSTAGGGGDVHRLLTGQTLQLGAGVEVVVQASPVSVRDAAVSTCSSMARVGREDPIIAVLPPCDAGGDDDETELMPIGTHVRLARRSGNVRVAPLVEPSSMPTTSSLGDALDRLLGEVDTGLRRIERCTPHSDDGLHQAEEIAESAHGSTNAAISYRHAALAESQAVYFAHS